MEKNLDKEPWDSSDLKANELLLSMFENIESFCEMPKKVNYFYEARVILSELVNKPLISTNGLVAYISKNSAKELLCGAAVNNSFEKQAHLIGIANIEQLFSNAIEPWDFNLNPEKSNEGLKAIRRLYSPMFYNDRIILIKLTVKEMKNKNEGNRLYSLKAINTDLKKNNGVQVT